MREKTYQTTLLIRGDSKDAVRSVQLTRDELEKLTGSQRKSASASQQFAAAFNKANGAVDKTSRAVQGLGGLIAGLGIGAFFKNVVANTIRQEKAVKQLETALKSTGGAAGFTATEMLKYASSLQDATTFGDEAIIESQAMLATFTDIQGVNFEKTTKMILDLSTAMGQDLKTSTIQLGKALNDPVANLGALSRTGIQFSGTQKDLIKDLVATGQKAEAQSVILAELERQFGGSAAAAKDTLGGALTSLGNTWTDLLEVQGSATGEMTASVRALEDVLADPAVKQSIESIASGMIRLGAAVAEALPKVVSFTKWLGDELAAQLYGIAGDDIPRLEQEFSKLSDELAFYEKNGHGASRATVDLRKKLAGLKVQIQEAYEAKERDAKSSKKQMAAMGEVEKQLEKTGKATINYTKAAIDATKTVQEGRKAHEKSNREFESAHKMLGDMVRKSEEYVEQLEFEVSLIGETEREQAILTAERKLGAGATQELKEKTREYTGELFDNKEAMKAAAEQTKQVAAAAKEMEKAWLDSRDVLSDFFFEFARDGNNAFDTLVDGFKAMIAKMIAEAAANQIILGVSSVASGLGYSGIANATATAGGGGGMPGIGSGFSGFGTGLYSGLGDAFSYIGADSLAQQSYFQGMTATPGSMLASAGAGLAGGFVGNAAFGGGGYSNIGATAGGLIGSIYGPIGAGVGSFIGSGIGSLFGGNNDGDNKGRADINLGTGVSDVYGVGNSFNQANVDAVAQIASQLQAIAATFGGSTAVLNVAAGNNSGLSLNGEKFGEDVEQFFNAATRAILEGADKLTPALKDLLLAFEGTTDETVSYALSLTSIMDAIERNPVDSAVADIKAANDAANNLYDAYFNQVDVIRNLVSSYDGSAQATLNLSNNLLAGEQAAYALAAGIQQISQSVTSSLQATASSIRESVLSDDELGAYRRKQGLFLETILENTTNPELIANVVGQLESIVSELFNAVDDPTTADAEVAATKLEEIAQTAKAQLTRSLGEVGDSWEATTYALGRQFDQAAEKVNTGGQQILDAALITQDAVANFGYWVEQLRKASGGSSFAPLTQGELV